MHYRALLLALVAALPSGAAAQAGDSVALTPGSEVRVVRIQPGGHRAELVRGRFERLSGDTASIRLSVDSIAMVPLGGDRALEVRAQGKSYIVPGALAGTLVGVVVGYVVGAASEPECPQGCMFEGAATISSASLGALAGMVIGGLVGSQIHETRWRPAPAAVRLGFGVVPATGGLGVRVEVHF